MYIHKLFKKLKYIIIVKYFEIMYSKFLLLKVFISYISDLYLKNINKSLFYLTLEMSYLRLNRNNYNTIYKK